MKKLCMTCIKLSLFLLIASDNSSFVLPNGFVKEDYYICGDAFLSFFKNVVIGRSNYEVTEPQCSFEPESIKDGDIIYVNTPYLSYFFNEIHPYIFNKYILVSHGGDDSVPGQKAAFLNDDKIIAWFAVNVDWINHPKLFHVPLGFANAAWEWGNKKVLHEVEEKINKGLLQRDKLLYMNFNKSTNVPLRSAVYDIFANKRFCTKAKPKPFRSYLHELAHYKFIVSPHGNGLDCHRTWEAILVGCIPIVKTSTLDPLYNDLPVLIVNDWEDVTEDLLNRKYIEFSQKPYDFRKLTINYWVEKIQAMQQAYKSSKVGDNDTNQVRSSAITYKLNGGRFGDNVLNYLHALWISYFYKIPLLYKPFEYSDQLVLHDVQQFAYDDYESFYEHKVDYIWATNNFVIHPCNKTLYTIAYFPERSTVWKYFHSLYFSVNWEDSVFKDMIRRVVRPRKKMDNIIKPPANKFSVALHIRTGGNYDTDYWVKATPDKFLTDAFYIDAIKTVALEHQNQPLYVFIFTDHFNPEVLVAKFKEALHNFSTIEFDYRKNHGGPESNVLEDLFSMVNFDCLIKSEANIPLIASKIHDFKKIIEPSSVAEMVNFSLNEKNSLLLRKEE